MGIKFQLLEIQSKNKESTANIISSYLCFENIVTSSTLNSRDEIQELYEDVWAKTNEFGETMRILIPRPPLGIKVNEVFGMGYYGKIFAQFVSFEVAIVVKKALHGMAHLESKMFVIIYLFIN